MNTQILFLAVVFWVMENSYFGWNWKPQSDAELLADGIVLVLLALAIVARTAKG